jgi:hypothetical protein
VASRLSSTRTSRSRERPVRIYGPVEAFTLTDRCPTALGRIPPWPGEHLAPQARGIVQGRIPRTQESSSDVCGANASGKSS